MPSQWRQGCPQFQPVKARLGDARPVKARLKSIPAVYGREGWSQANAARLEDYLFEQMFRVFAPICLEICYAVVKCCYSLANRVCINGNDFISYSLLKFIEVCWFRSIYPIFEVTPQKIIKWCKIRGFGWSFYSSSSPYPPCWKYCV